MGKTRAEIQREYRARKKEKEGVGYLQKERDRVKKYYTPIAERSKKDAKHRREKVKSWVKKHRERKKEVKAQISSEDNRTLAEDEAVVSSTVSDEMATPNLTVKLPFPTTNARTRKRVSRATARQRRQIARLKTENKALTRKFNAARRRYERTSQRLKCALGSKHFGKDKSMPSKSNVFTPRKRAYTELREDGISPSKIPQRIVKRLILANVVSDEIKAARLENGKHGKTIISQIISGKIVKKYRMKSALGTSVGLDRHSLKSTTKKSYAPKYTRMHQLQRMTKEKVLEFLTRDDNSRQMPGKADFKKTDGEQKQKRVLNDSLRNLYLKFSSETPDMKLSFTTFCRMRPPHVCLTKYIARNQCLCQKHQNFALLLKATKAHGANVTLNPDEYIRNVANSNPNELMSQVTSDEVTFEQWKRVDCDDGKKRMKIVPSTCCKEDFSSFFVKQRIPTAR